jgi:hypothetical protein
VLTSPSGSQWFLDQNSNSSAGTIKLPYYDALRDVTGVMTLSNGANVFPDDTTPTLTLGARGTTTSYKFQVRISQRCSPNEISMLTFYGMDHLSNLD